MKLSKMLCLALALSIVGLFVKQGWADTAKSAPTINGRAGVYENLVFYGSTPLRIIKSATAQQLTIGHGFLDAICPLGGVSGQYSLALDSAEGASGLTVDSESVAISRNAFVRLDSAADNADGGCWVPRWGPVRFERGLVGVQSAATHSTIYYVHSSSGTNPGYYQANKP